MGSPKAIYSFNGPLMWFVLYLPVLPDVPLDSDETELFIGSSWSWYRRVITHTHTHTHTHNSKSCSLPVPTWTRSGCTVRVLSMKAFNHAKPHADLLDLTCCLCSFHPFCRSWTTHSPAGSLTTLLFQPQISWLMFPRTCCCSRLINRKKQKKKRNH